jgi:peptidoglycan biosynthesis protein MviN/MurJ (putative lipid II flippase)
LGYLLVGTMGVAGLALAFSAGSFVNAVILFIYLHKIYPNILDKEMIFSFVKITFISLAMGVFVWSTLHIMAGFVDMNRFVGILIQTTVSLVVGLIFYLGLSYFFNCQELKWALTRKINRSSNTGVEGGEELKAEHEIIEQ